MIGRSAGNRDMPGLDIFEISVRPIYRLAQRFFCHHEDEISHGRRRTSTQHLHARRGGLVTRTHYTARGSFVSDHRNLDGASGLKRHNERNDSSYSREIGSNNIIALVEKNLTLRKL